MAKKTLDANSAAMAVKAMVNASKGDLLPPAHCNMRPGDGPFWQGIIHARARDEWTSSNLVVAAQLARVQHDIEREQQLLDSEGVVVVNDKGTQIANPRCVVLERMSSRQLALMRTLQMSGVAVGDKRDQLGKRRIEDSARRAKKELEDEDESLLA